MRKVSENTKTLIKRMTGAPSLLDSVQLNRSGTQISLRDEKVQQASMVARITIHNSQLTSKTSR